jgi:hypothetical protein
MPDKRSFGFRFPHAFCRFRAPRVELQQEMTDLMGQNRKFHRRVQAGQQLDAARRASSVSRADVFRVLQLNATRGD